MDWIEGIAILLGVMALIAIFVGPTTTNETRAMTCALVLCVSGRFMLEVVLRRTVGHDPFLVGLFMVGMAYVMSIAACLGNLYCIRQRQKTLQQLA